MILSFFWLRYTCSIDSLCLDYAPVHMLLQVKGNPQYLVPVLHSDTKDKYQGQNCSDLWKPLQSSDDHDMPSGWGLWWKLFVSIRNESNLGKCLKRPVILLPSEGHSFINSHPWPLQKKDHDSMVFHGSPWPTMVNLIEPCMDMTKIMIIDCGWKKQTVVFSTIIKNLKWH